MNKRTAHNKLTREKVIEQFQEKHGDAYGYDRVIYVGNLTPVEIYCKKHDKYFNIIPKNHKKGCVPYCCEKDKMSKLNSKGKEKFSEELVEMYGDLYDTSKVEYKNNTTEVELICKLHGSFLKRPFDLLHGQACPKCRLKSKYNNVDLFIEESVKLFGDITDHSKVKDINSRGKVDLTCTVHDHEFTIRVTNRLGGQKCPKCAEENYSLLRKKTTEQFIEESVEVYGDLHDYTDTIYEGCRKELEIRCKKHDSKFKTLPNNYLNGFTCPKCRMEDSKYSGKHHHTKDGYVYLAKGRTTHLYLIKCNKDEETFYKIGKTFRELSERFNKNNMPYDYEELYLYSSDASTIWDLEEKLHKKYKKYKHKVGILFNGYSECYKMSLPINEIINLK